MDAIDPKIPCSCVKLLLLLTTVLSTYNVAVSLVFTRTPGDQVVIIGYNNSNINLIWRLNLAGKTFSSAKIVESPTSSIGAVTPLYFSNRSPQILTKYQDRVNVNVAFDNGAVILTLVIHNVTQSDKIYYQAEIEDNFGATKTDNLVMSIYVRPRVKINPEQLTICENQAISFSCLVEEGIPEPEIFFTRNIDGTILVSSYKKSFNYNIGPINRHHSRSYSCLATNAAGSEKKTASLHVEIPAKVLNVTPSAWYKRDTTITLECKVEGDPPPSVMWINVTDGSVLQYSAIRTSYVIQSLSSHNKGTYICVAQNRCGKDSGKIIVDVITSESVTKYSDKCTATIAVLASLVVVHSLALSGRLHLVAITLEGLTSI